MQVFSQYRGLSKQIYILSICRALVSMGIMFLFPYLTFILTDVQGLTPTTASLIISLCSAGSMAGNFIGGHFSDKIGRRKTFIAGVSVLAVAMLVTAAFCFSHIFIVFLLILYIANNIVLPSVSTMILDCSSKDNETSCYSLMYLAGNLGCAVGPMIGSLLYNTNLRLLFVLMSITYIILLIIAVTSIHETGNRAQIVATDTSVHTSASTWAVVRGQKGLLLFLVLLSLLTLCYINLDFALPIRLRDLFGTDTGSAINSFVWTLNGIMVIVITPFATTFMKHFRPHINASIGAFLYFIGFGLYAFVGHPELFLLVVPVWTAGEIILSTSSAILISDSCPDTHKGRAMALYELARNAGKLIGPLSAGLLLLFVESNYVWMIIASTCLAVSLLLRRMGNIK